MSQHPIHKITIVAANICDYLSFQGPNGARESVPFEIGTPFGIDRMPEKTKRSFFPRLEKMKSGSKPLLL
jgi:hypothetical protein